MFKTLRYVVPVYTDDEYACEPTHCSIEIKPNFLWKIFKFLVVGWIARTLSRDMSGVSFYFTEMEWLKQNQPDKDAPQGAVTEETYSAAFQVYDDDLRGKELEVPPYGYIRFRCYKKYGASFYSESIHFSELFRKEYFSWA